MRAYTLSVLTTLANSNSPIVEKEIVAWVNSKLEKAGKTSSLRNFQDSAIADAKIVIDLVDAIKPGCINYELLKTTSTAEVRFHFCHHFLKFFVVELIFFFKNYLSQTNRKLCCSITFRIVWPTPNMPSRWPERLVLVYMLFRKI